MEPLDSDKKDRSSKRRVSSILKAARKSNIPAVPEQQEATVECAKPVEKRISRRVSFAPTNDVLLFSKDVKNASSVISPSQESLISALTAQNSVHVEATQARIQQIMGMETLLNAPLHAFQHIDDVRPDSGDNFGEKTVIFSVEDALMDVTHSHTINIGNNEELFPRFPHQHTGVLRSSGEETVLFSAADASMDMTLSHTMNMTSQSTVPSFDPAFKNFLESISKPRVSNVNGRTGLSTDVSLDTNRPPLKTLRNGLDKENQAPHAMDRSLNKTSSTGDPSCGGGLSVQGDVNMDMTEALTGRIEGFTEDDDEPLKCLFPTPDMYACSDGASQTVNPTAPQLQSRKSKGPSDPDSVLKTTSEDGGQRATDVMSVKNLSRLPLHPKHQGNVGTKGRAEAQGHTARISSGRSAVRDQNCPSVSARGLDPGPCVPPGHPAVPLPTNAALIPPEITNSHPFNATMSMYGSSETDTVCPEGDMDMDMTEAQTGCIIEAADALQCLFPTQQMYPQPAEMKKSETSQQQRRKSSVGTGLLSSLAASVKTKVQRQQVETPDERREKTMRFSADDAWMDMTTSHTGKIQDFKPQSVEQPQTAGGEKTTRFTLNDAAMDMTTSLTVNIAAHCEPQTHRNVEFVPTGGEKTMRFSADDAEMDVTQSHTANIATHLESQTHQTVEFAPSTGDRTVRFNVNDAAMDMTQSHTANIVDHCKPQRHRNMEFVPDGGEKTMRFSADDAAMDMTTSHVVNIIRDVQPQTSVALAPSSGDKTIRVSADEACMDVTRSHTANITPFYPPQTIQSVGLVPPSGDRTVRFSVNDAEMDMTQSHTANIVDHCKPQRHRNVEFVPAGGEKTMRFSADDAAMDMTTSHVVNIIRDVQPQTSVLVPPSGDRTLRFSVNDAAMDITQSHTANIVDHCESGGEKTMRFRADDAAMDMTTSHVVNIIRDVQPQTSVLAPSSGDKTVTFSVSDAAMEQTSCLTVNIAHHSLSDSALPVRKSEAEGCDLPGDRSASGCSLDPAFRPNQSKSSLPWAVPTITRAPAGPSSQQPADTNVLLLKKTPRTMVEDGAPGVLEKSVSNFMENEESFSGSPEDIRDMDMTEVQADELLRQEATSEQQSAYVQETSTPHMNITNETLDSGEARNEPELNNTSPSSQDLSSPCAADSVPPEKTRQTILAGFQSKLRRLSHIINTDPDATDATDGSQLEPGKNSEDTTESSPVTKIEEPGNCEDTAGEQCPDEEEPSETTSPLPFQLKTKELLSRLSVGGFKPKLPRRSKAENSMTAGWADVMSAGEDQRTFTVNVAQITNVDQDISDIYDEELGSCEDLSETLNRRKCTEKTEVTEFNVDETFEEDVFEDNVPDVAPGQKRHLPEEEDKMQEKKRMNVCEVFEQELVCGSDTPVDAHTTATHVTDRCQSSSSRCDTTLQSTFQQSMFESQLDEFSGDVQRKLTDGSITLLEFFKIFNIDFVIHDPRQSALPGRLSSDVDPTQMDVLKYRHIARPKQTVYETDIQSLKDKVGGLKFRMQDLDKPLKVHNRRLWQEIRHFSETELKSFGAKLKERNNWFRKMSKAECHHMKELLYSNLLLTAQEQQQKVQGMFEEADKMIECLDGCVDELQTELLALEEAGVDNKPSVRSQQEELKNVTDTLAEKSRQTCELELENKQNASKVKSLVSEVENLEHHVDVLNMASEWKITEKKENLSVFSFLYGTLQLQLLYDSRAGPDAAGEQKMSHITFDFQLDEGQSRGHARLVHQLLRQYAETGSSWVEKYPTSSYVPKLLVDVGLVVGRCRLLGEELRLMEMWGSMKLDILELSCEDTDVRILFSSLKAFSKFEVVLAVGLSSGIITVQLQRFRNIIGNTTIQQVAQVVAEFSPGHKLLTKIVKKIHNDLL